MALRHTSVSLRTREIGIRMSLAARTAEVLRMFVCETLTLAIIRVRNWSRSERRRLAATHKLPLRTWRDGRDDFRLRRGRHRSGGRDGELLARPPGGTGGSTAGSPARTEVLRGTCQVRPFALSYCRRMTMLVPLLSPSGSWLPATT